MWKDVRRIIHFLAACGLKRLSAAGQPHKKATSREQRCQTMCVSVCVCVCVCVCVLASARVCLIARACVRACFVLFFLHRCGVAHGHS